MTTVSIIIPAYNYGHYLAEAIDSALAQTYSDIEIIVVDDGSTDNTRDVCEVYGDRIRYHHKENAGLSAARNTGIDLSKGEFLVFLDADDVLLPDMVEACLNAFSEAEHTLAVVGCRRRLINENGEYLDGVDQGGFAGRLEARDLLLKNRITVSGALVRAKIFSVCGVFDDSLTSSEDRDMWIRCSTKFDLMTLSRQLVNYRVHSSNMSHNADRMNENMTRVLRKARTMTFKEPLSWLFWHSVFAFKDYQVAWMINSQGQSWRAAGFILLSVLRYPFPFAADSVDEPRLFRIRALRRFLFDSVLGRGR